MRVKVSLNTDELNKLNFYVLVEMWEKTMNSLSKRKLYEETFSIEEQKIISSYYRIFHSWYLRTGTPEEHSMMPIEVLTIKRAIDFFGTV